MFVSAHLLEAYTRSLRRASSAECCSLFVPAFAGGLESPVLLHDGPGPPVPELSSLATARELHRRGFEAARDADRELGGALVRRSSVADGYLVALPSLDAVLGADATSMSGHERRSGGSPSGSRVTHRGWVGLRGPSLSFPSAEGAPPPSLSAVLLGIGAALAWQTRQLFSVLEDPVTGLPERTMLQAVLFQALHHSRSEGSPVSLLLISPRDLTSINERFGRRVGDAALREVANRLGAFFRRSDLVSRYGAAVFAIVLPDTGSEEARNATRRLLRSIAIEPLVAELRDERPPFAAGLACFDPKAEEIRHPHDLLRRADLALGADRRKREPGGTLWTPELAGSAEASDRLSGIFTAELSRDYRNMVLLWDTINAVATHSELTALVADVAARLFRTLRPDELALFFLSDETEPVLFRALISSPHAGGAPIETDDLALGDEQRRLLAEACRVRRPVDSLSGQRGDTPWRSHAFPLLAQGRAIGCLYLGGDAETLELDPLNVSFLDALASQLAQAMERARAHDREEKELRDELSALRKAVGEAGIVWGSDAMHRVLRQVERIAPSDATVLLLGESGTGKEILARSIHESSPRSRGPFVVIDCGAMAPSLLEAELFGHERGAFTGAHERRTGRLAEAAGGTVLLDEIGELPVDLQAKLLRFVQEKQLVPVGGSRSRDVDTRILAATHRDLAVEVAAGRFRADLYYRLNVIRIQIPPLRERAEDVLLLANHFLRIYTLRYDREVLGLTPAAERALRAHRWPGNVRELQNRMTKAVLLCDRERIGPEELELPCDASESDRAVDTRTTSAPASTGRGAGSPDDAWAALRNALREATEKTLIDRSTRTSPVGTWLEADLVREAVRRSSGILSAAASALGVPESTLRRKSVKAANNTERPPGWTLVEAAAGRILRSPRRGAENILLRARQTLLETLHTRSPRLPMTTCAALMGVTPQTLRRWTRGLARNREAGKVAARGRLARQLGHLRER